MSQMEDLKKVYLAARSIPPFVALDAARHAETAEERNFYAYIADMNLQRAQWEFIKKEEREKGATDGEVDPGIRDDGIRQRSD